MSYLTLKLIHILSSTLLFGTGLGTAFFMWRAHLSGQVQVIATVSREVVRADWWFTLPAVVVQPLTGWLLMQQLGYDWQQTWISLSIGLYLLIGACWLPVLWLQHQMHKMAVEAERNGTQLPDRYARFFRIWFALGWPAFIAVLMIFYLMVNKPQ
jgi:uncharacterized membrane protein